MDGPAMLTVLAAIEHHARVTPRKPALVIGVKGAWQQFCYADLQEETERWARIWLATGAAPRSVVFIILQHCPEMYPAFLGAMRAGLIPSFMPYPTIKQDPNLYWRSHQDLFNRVAPSCVLTYEALIEPIRRIADLATCQVIDVAETHDEPAQSLPLAPDIDNPGSIAVLQHSSGTTGLKKGVALTWRQIRDQIEAVALALDASGEDRLVSWLPIYHDMGLIATFLLPFTLGAVVISIDAFDWLMRPDMFFDDIARFRGTISWLPNFAFNHLVRTRDRDRHYDLSSLRALVNCSEPCKAESIETFIEIFTPHGLRPNAVQVCYGMAEIVFAASHTPAGTMPPRVTIDRAAMADRSEAVVIREGTPEGARFLSCGRPIQGVEIRIVPRPAATGMARFARGLAEMGIGTKRLSAVPIGEIQVRSPFLFDGYFRNPAATDAGMDGSWFRSGDIGFILDGELYVCGRSKEMLIVHGRNYYANDIEALINPLAGIKPGRVVAVGVFDSVTGSEEAVVLAETMLEDPEERAELEQAIRKRVFDVLNLTLRRVEIAGEGTLVKTTSGKISRNENIKRLSGELVAS
jgi:fatty-acyl-CoA synthase